MVELLANGYDVVCLDNFSNSAPEAIKRVEKIAGKRVTTVTGDVRDREVMSRVFKRPIDGVIHFAALKAVGESVSQPVDYYGNNVGGTLALLDAMHERKVQRLVFSSSATVYGVPDKLPIAEDAAVRPINPYGHTKAMVEQILRDWCAAGSGTRGDLAALFQSDRRARKWLDRRRPTRRAEQSFSVHHAGGDRQARQAHDMGQRLADA